MPEYKSPLERTQFRSSTIPIMQTHTDDKARYSITIADFTPAQVFAFCRDFSNLPLILKGMWKVDRGLDGQSHWRIELPSGFKAEWNAQIIEEEVGTMFAWRSLPESQITTSGSMWFTPAPAGRGTIVTLSMDYAILGGQMTEIAAMLMGEDPDLFIRQNLRRMKAFLETGEIPTTDGQPHGKSDPHSGKETH